MTNALGTFAFTFDGATERLSTVSYPNGQHSEFAYAGNLREQLLQRVTHFLPGNAKLSEFTYGYNARGMITNWTQFQAGRLKTWSPSYDPVNRLTNVVETISAGPATTIAWAYDAADNRMLEQVGTDKRESTFNALNQLTGFSTNTPVAPSSYEWDAENRLTAISNATGRVEFAYDGLDRRTRITLRNAANVITSDRRYLWCGTQICEERDASGANVLKRYSAHGLQNVSAPELPIGAYFYTRDHLGSVREMTSAGGVASAFDYTAYGEQTQLGVGSRADFGFTGHFQTRDGSALLAPFRAYSPGISRWLNRDPMGESGGLNLYAYVELDPINRVDRLGLFPSWTDVKEWAKKQPEKVKKWAKEKLQKDTEIGKLEKQVEDFDEASKKILDTELEVKEALDDPDCGHSGARLLKIILDFIPKSIQLGPINNADLFGKTLDEGVKNVDLSNEIRNQRLNDFYRAVGN
jgi:RHS repeat-associated protein